MRYMLNIFIYYIYKIMCFLAICIFLSEMSVHAFCSYFIVLFAFVLMLNFKSSMNFLCTNPLSDVCLAIICPSL